jgi:hypothetical protein
VKVADSEVLKAARSYSTADWLLSCSGTGKAPFLTAFGSHNWGFAAPSLITSTAGLRSRSAPFVCCLAPCRWVVGCTLLCLALPVMGSVRLEQKYLVLVFGACDACGANQNTNTTLVRLVNLFRLVSFVSVFLVQVRQFVQSIQLRERGCRPADSAARLL